MRGDNGDGDPERTYYLYDGDNPVVELDAQGRATAIMTWGLLGPISRDVRGADDASRGTGAGGLSPMSVDIRRLGMSTNFAVFVAPGAAPAGLPPAVAN